MRLDSLGSSPHAFGNSLADVTAQAEAALFNGLFGPEGLLPLDSFGASAGGSGFDQSNPFQIDPSLAIALLVALLGQQLGGGGGRGQCRGTMRGGGSGHRRGSWSSPQHNRAVPHRDLSSLPTGTANSRDFLQTALSQQGKRYVFGAEANGLSNPGAFDCSELVEWSAARAGVNFVDGSANQRRNSIPISVEQALNTPGALLFRNGHVAISMGDGQNTIEAKGRRHGVLVTSGRGRFTSGGLIPGMNYT